MTEKYQKFSIQTSIILNINYYTEPEASSVVVYFLRTSVTENNNSWPMKYF